MGFHIYTLWFEEAGARTGIDLYILFVPCISHSLPLGRVEGQGLVLLHRQHVYTQIFFVSTFNLKNCNISRRLLVKSPFVATRDRFCSLFIG